MRNDEENVDFDESEEVHWEESSPNSIQKYAGFKSSKKNVLISNKGKVKDTEKFKTELLELLTRRNVTKQPKGKAVSMNFKLPMSHFKNFRSENVYKQKIETRFLGLYNDKSGLERVIQRNFYKRSPTKGMYVPITPRSLSRKLSSSKILKQMQENMEWE